MPLRRRPMIAFWLRSANPPRIRSILSAPTGTWVRPVDRFRLDAFAWLEKHLPPDQASIYGALLLGYRRQVSDFWQEQWNRAGVTHLLSISGQHLGLVALGAFWLIRRGCRFRPGLIERFSDQQMALWGALLLALLYALIGGMALPTWRSAIMLTLFFASLSLYRQPDLPSALAFSALVILLLQPFSLWSPSFQLSYASLLGIFLLYPRLTPLRTALANTLSGLFRALPGRWWSAFSRIKPWVWRVPRLFAEAFWVSVAANIMVLPLVAFHFYGISLAGFVANTLLVPLFGFITLPLGLFSLALFSINEWLGIPSLILGGWSLALGNWLVLFFSRLSWAYYWVGKIPVVGLLAFYGAMALILTSWGWRRKALGAGLGMLGLAAGWLCFNALTPRDPLETAWSNAAPGSLQVLVADVGQGSSTLVRFPGGTTMLVDGGGFYDDSFDIGRSVLAPLLWQLGIRTLDVVVLSHDHPDHRNGLRFILSHFEVGCFWESGIEDDSEPSAKLRAIAEQRAIPVRQASEVVKEHPVGPCRLQVLHPAPGYLQSHPQKRDLNNLSLVLQIDYEDTHVIIPGDIDQSVEQMLFAEANLAGKVLLVSPHHGSQHSNSPLLLERLHPDAVLFSSGHANRFGFPHKDVVTRYRERRIPCYRTDLQGAILGISDGTGWKILTERALGWEGAASRAELGQYVSNELYGRLTADHVP